MEIKIILKRKVNNDVQVEIRPLLIELRQLALEQEGYIAGETLINMDDPEDVLVLSTWRSKQDWEIWLASEKRQQVQQKIDEILGEPTYYRMYYSGK